VQVGRGEDVAQVPGAVRPVDDADRRPVPFDLADDDLAVKELLLVVVDDARGDVDENGLAGVVPAGEGEFAEGNPAEQAEAGALQSDGGPRQVVGQPGEHLLADHGRARPVLVGEAAQGQAAGHDADQAPD
jgi:hypothetical protein